MIIIVLHFALSALVIVVAGFFLTKFTNDIAIATGWGKMFLGSLLLAGATSLPEFTVNLKAIQLNLPDLAAGDLLGASLFNLLALAVLDFSFPSLFRKTVFSPAFLHHSFSAVLTMVLTAIVGIAIISRIEISFLGVSIFSWTLATTYFFGLRIIYMMDEKVENTTESEVSTKIKNRPLYLSFLGYAIAASFILFAAPYLTESADKLAIMSGLGHTFVGTTLVAFATTLPELVSTIVAFRIGAPDLALGNIFGSNAFNMLLFLPLDFMYSKELFSSMSTIHVLTAFGVIIATGLAVMGQLYRRKKRLLFIEPSSEVVVATIVLVLFLLYHAKPN